MADLVIPIFEYIGQSSWNWYTDEYERATNCDDLRWAIEYAGYTNQAYDRIVLEIGNCYGGFVDDGIEMYHYLQGLGVPVHTRILGTVASMGTIIPLAGDTIECAATSQWMVHAPSNELGGTAAEIAAALKSLSNDTANLAAIYAARTGADEATIAGWMSQDTWLTAAEALAAGLCTSVVPLRPKTAPAAAPTEAQARQYRQRFAQAVARADKRTPSTAKTPAAPAAAAPAPAPKSAPMATTAANKPKPRAAKPAAAPKSEAKKSITRRFLDWLAEAEAEVDSEADGSEAAADPQPTVLADNNGTLYTDGPLAVDSAVFTDEQLTEAAADGEYDTEDSQTITVAAGIVTALGPMASATGGTETAATATAFAKRLERLEASVGTLTTERDNLKAENDRLKKIKPALPVARAARPNADAPDAKNPKVPKAADPGAGQL